MDTCWLGARTMGCAHSPSKPSFFHILDTPDLLEHLEQLRIVTQELGSHEGVEVVGTEEGLRPLRKVLGVVEEIVAWVDGDIITKVDLERQESKLIKAARERYSGDELRRRLEAVRRTTLLDIIDHKILHHRGQQLWGATEIEESLYRDFRQQNGLSDDEEFEQSLVREGLTVERLKHLLSEKFVPEKVIEHEVTASMPGISDLEARDYYDRHPDEFMAPAEAAPDGSHIVKLESRSAERLIPFDESIDRAREALQNERYNEQLEAFVEMARGEAEWWVKAEYRDYLPQGVKPTREEAPW